MVKEIIWSLVLHLPSCLLWWWKTVHFLLILCRIVLFGWLLVLCFSTYIETAKLTKYTELFLTWCWHFPSCCWQQKNELVGDLRCLLAKHFHAPDEHRVKLHREESSFLLIITVPWTGIVTNVYVSYTEASLALQHWVVTCRSHAFQRMENVLSEGVSSVKDIRNALWAWLFRGVKVLDHLQSVNSVYRLFEESCFWLLPFLTALPFHIPACSAANVLFCMSNTSASGVSLNWRGKQLVFIRFRM